MGLALDGPKKKGCTLEELKAIVEEAHDKGIPVAVHAHGGPGLDISAEALGKGDSIDHGSYIFEHDEALKKMAQKGIFYVPTWYGRLGFIERETDSAKKADMIRSLKETVYLSLHRARSAGVKIAPGTDVGPCSAIGYEANLPSLGLELSGYVNYGDIPPLEAISWATKNAAECLALSNLGTIEKGKIADIIVVDGDPVKDISVLQEKKRIDCVIKCGQVVARKGSIIPSQYDQQVQATCRFNAAPRLS